MALADKKYLRIYEDGGSGTDALTNAEQLEFKRQFEDNEYIVDENFKEAFGVILYAIQSLSEDIDEIRRFTYTSTAAGDLGAVLASNSKVTDVVSASNAATGLHNSLAGHQHVTDTSVIGKGSYWIHSRDISDLTPDEKSDHGYESYGLNIYSGNGEGSWYDFNQTFIPNDSINRRSGGVKIHSGDLFNTGSGENNTGAVTVDTGAISFNGYSTPLTLTCSASDDSNTVTHSATGSDNQVIPGATVTGTGIDGNTTVVSVAANRESFTISKNTTAAISGGTLTFTSGQYNAGNNVPAGSGDAQSGNLNLRTGWVKTTSGDATTGDIAIQTGSALSSSGTVTRGSVTLGGSVVIVEPKLKINGNAIQDNDGVDCITFNSSGNTTIANTLNASLTGNVTGNAATATKLAASKNIGGVAFDGSLDIDLPGVNTTGNQNTSGNAATATTATTAAALTSGDKTINGDLTVTAGTSGDATLIIEADTGNGTNENYNPQLWFRQDGGINAGAVQMTHNKLQIISNESAHAGISFLTGEANNTGTTNPSTNATERMAISSAGVVSTTGDMTVGGALTVTGGISVANGGTGASSFASGQVLYGNGTGAIQDTANITTDGSWITAQAGGFQGKTHLDTAYVTAINRSQGNIITFGSTTSMLAGSIYYLDSFGGWQQANADTPADATGMMGLALGTSSGVHGLLLNGIGMTAQDFGNMGDILYLATADGKLTSTAPSSSGDIVRVMGYALHATSGLVYFNPSGTWVEIT
mgnify:CR=1 FL=1|tara:strand:+ start:439 stop:2712 length:2274 start_codon:yes stop_codon:yes gene_type:complete